MKIAVLARPDGWHFKDLKRAAGDRHEIFACGYQCLSTLISNSENVIESEGRDLSSVDAVFVRAMPPGSLSQIVFRMDLLQQLLGKGVLIVNSPKTIEASVDKYLSLALLRMANIPVPRTGVCQTVEDGLKLFADLDQDVVAKPIFGSQGRGITRITNEAEAQLWLRACVDRDDVIYFQEFIDHRGFDLRLFVIGEKVFAMKRENDHWITNVSCGGTPWPHSATALEIEIAIGAAQAVNGKVVGIDLVYDSRNQPYVVDVNSAPGWQAISTTLTTDIGAEILAALDSGAFDNGPAIQTCRM